MRFVLLNGGPFYMGSPDSDLNASFFEKPRRQVSVSRFALGAFEVTNEQFCLFLNDGNGQYHVPNPPPPEPQPAYPNPITETSPGVFEFDSGTGKLPAVYITWDAAKAFCDWATTQTGWTVRLPREAEWEFACRAGTQTIYYWGNNPDSSKANYKSSKLQIVGTYPANPWGFFDMSGSVMEWCADWYGNNYYQTGPTSNPTGPDTGDLRVTRGGSWASSAETTRSSARNASLPTNSDWVTGFRCAITMP